MNVFQSEEKISFESKLTFQLHLEIDAEASFGLDVRCNR